MLIYDNEVLIPITGSPIKTFWAGVSTADQNRPFDFVSSAEQVSGPDGYVELTSDARVVPEQIEPFYTGIRTAYAAVPLVSLYHGQDWFQCFSTKIGVDFSHGVAQAKINVFNTTTAQGKDISLELAATSALLTAFGRQFDVTSSFLSIANMVTSSNEIIRIDDARLYVVARRTSKKVLGALAEFDFKVVLYSLTAYVLCEFTDSVSAADLYHADFMCVLGKGAESHEMVLAPKPGAYTIDEDVVVTITPAYTGSVVYYTLDGSAPTDASYEYATPVNVTDYSKGLKQAAVTLTAIEVTDGVIKSVATATYTMVYPVPVVSGYLHASGTVFNWVPALV